MMLPEQTIISGKSEQSSARVNHYHDSTSSSTSKLPLASEDNPQRGLSAFTILVLSVAVLGGLVFGLDIGTGAVTSMDYFRREMGMPTLDDEDGDATKKISLFPLVFHISSLIGAPFAGTIADKFGRKPVVVIASSLYAAGALWQSLAGLISPSFSWTSILLGRALGGIGNGFILTIMPLYASELAPAKYRGQAITFFQLNITLGILLMAIFNQVLKDYIWGWRLAFGIQIIPCLIIVIFGVFVLPDSPQYLMRKGDESAARKALARLAVGQKNHSSIVDHEIETIRAEVEEEKLTGKGGVMELFRGAGFPAFLCGFFIALSQNVTGVNWLLNYSTILFKALGFQPFAYDIGLKTVNFLATIISLFLVERLGRKFLTLWGVVFVLIIFTVLPTVMYASGVEVQTQDADSKTKSFQMFMLVLLFIFQAVFAMSWGSLGWVIPSEVFPLRLRGVGMSSAVAANMLTNICLGDYGYVNIQVSSIGLYGTMYIIVALNLVIVLTTVVYLQPETKGVSMENMRFIFAYEKGGNEKLNHGTLSQFFARNKRQAFKILTFKAVKPEEDEHYLNARAAALSR